MEPAQDQQQPVVSNHTGSSGHKKGPWLWVTLAALPILVIAGALIIWVSSGSNPTASKQAQQATDAQAAAITIDLTANAPRPAAVTIRKGQSVTWENQDDQPHRLTADQSLLPGFDSADVLAKGDTYTYTFESTGTFHYYDPLNPTTYNGTVVVE
jgi:plastocyanin